jgi:hypothetical protein
MGVAFALDDDFGLETMAVQAPAFMGGGHMRQEMSGLELKGFA